MKKILMLHCVNHNMYGKRDPKQYGTITLDEINRMSEETAKEVGYELDTFQTNHEGEMVDKIHEAYYAGYDGVIINPGAWTHYSYAIHDALEILECPIIEVHMSNIFNREGFRSNSVIAPVATGMIAGMEEYVYTLAIRALKDMLG
ncbi:MAG TPA: 3-dehydroquinate dehydratase [Candidatus Mediterraneibacter vanvlietii]|nr:3-dehydroquinate dehydratase [Candidatus Mediterraneibacter vanvlietii]